MVITIDGPAGAGKSSAARRLATELGFRFLDTGAMYRAVTWAVLQRGIDPNDAAAVAELADQLHIEVDGGEIWVEGNDVSDAIRDPRVAQNISAVADNPRVRRRLSQLQRQIAAGGNYVCEGRDQGSEVFPDAVCKFFLTASTPRRAMRRQAQLKDRGIDVELTDLIAQQTERDQRDEARPIGRLTPAADAIWVLSDDLSLDEVVAELKRVVLERVPGLPD